MARFTITISDALDETLEIRRVRLGYRSKREALEALIRYDGLTQKEHHVTSGWAAMSGLERDALDAAVLLQVKSGQGLHGSWFEARIREAVSEINAAKDEPTTKAVSKKIGLKIAKGEPPNKPPAG